MLTMRFTLFNKILSIPCIIGYTLYNVFLMVLFSRKSVQRASELSFNSIQRKRKKLNGKTEEEGGCVVLYTTLGLYV